MLVCGGLGANDGYEMTAEKALMICGRAPDDADLCSASVVRVRGGIEHAVQSLFPGVRRPVLLPQTAQLMRSLGALACLVFGKMLHAVRVAGHINGLMNYVIRDQDDMYWLRRGARLVNVLCWRLWL